MTCPARSTQHAKGAELVGEILQEVASNELTLELVCEAREEAEWNKGVVKHHYLKEHHMVGESLRYVAKLNGKPVALLGWSSAAFHLRARDGWIGWSDSLRKSRRSLVACNARFVLLGARANSINSASQILKLNLDRLSDD